MGQGASFTTILEYGKEGWKSRLNKQSAERLASIAFNISKDRNFQEFVNIMDTCCDYFYPDYPKERRPWQQHLVWKANGTVEREILKKTQNMWHLDWYWKILITSMPEWSKRLRGENLVIRLSQIRNWVMMTISDGDGFSSRRKSSLLKAPVFGHSDRIIGWDQYWLYLLTAKDILKNWSKYQYNGRSQLDKAFFMGRHDVNYNISLKSLREINKRSFEIKLEPDLTLVFERTESEKRDPIELIRVPVYGSNREKKKKNTYELLLASDRVCDAMSQISDIWNDHTLKTVHLNAPPGSGKEVMADSIIRLRYFAGDSRKIVLAQDSPTQNDTLLFGKIGTSHRSKHEIGIVKLTKNGVLVIDEIDKTDEATRTSLLRLLENEKFIIPGSTKEDDIKGIAPLYIFLSSKPTSQIYTQCGPSDFWTRIAFTVEMKHPLDIQDDVERRRVIQQYLWLFWIKHIKTLLSVKKTRKRKGRPKKRIRLEQIARDYVNLVKQFFLNREVIEHITGELSCEIDTRFGKISIRNLRSIAGRCAFKLVQWLLHSKPCEWASEAGKAVDQIKVAEEKRIKMLNLLEECVFQGATKACFDDEELKETIRKVINSSLELRVEYPG